MGTSAEPEVKGDLFAPDHRYIFDQQPDHAFTITVVGSGIFPEPWKIVCQRQDCRSLFIVEYSAVLLATLFVVMLSIAHGSQLLVPVRFERIGNESVFRINTHISALCEVRLVPGTLNVLFSQPI